MQLASLMVVITQVQNGDVKKRKKEKLCEGRPKEYAVNARFFFSFFISRWKINLTGWKSQGREDVLRLKRMRAFTVVAHDAHDVLPWISHAVCRRCSVGRTVSWRQIKEKLRFKTRRLDQPPFASSYHDIVHDPWNIFLDTVVALLTQVKPQKVVADFVGLHFFVWHHQGTGLKDKCSEGRLEKRTERAICTMRVRIQSRKRDQCPGFSTT